MRDSRPCHVAASLLLLLAVAAPRPACAQLPEDRRTLTRSVSYAEMVALLSSVNGRGPVTTSVEATTSGGRSVHLVHATRGGTPSFRILFYAQQHGDEVSGKDALLYMVRDIARDPRAPPARRRPLGPADDEPGRGRGRDPPQRRRGRPEPRPPGARAAGDPGAAPGGAARAAPPRRRLPRVHARLEAAAEPGLDRVARHHHGRREQPAVRPGGRRRGAALGGRRGARGRGCRARVLPLHAWAAYRPTRSSATPRRTSTPASTRSACTAGSPSSSRRPCAARRPTRRPTSPPGWTPTSRCSGGSSRDDEPPRGRPRGGRDGPRAAAARPSSRRTTCGSTRG